MHQVDRQRLLFHKERQSSDSLHGSSRLEIRGIKPFFPAGPISCYYTMMNRTAFIEKLTEIQRTVEQLLGQLQSSEHDAFAAHLYQSRREYRLARDHSDKSGKQIDYVERASQRRSDNLENQAVLQLRYSITSFK